MAAGPSGTVKGIHPVDRVMGLVTIVLAILVALTYPSELRWIGHAAVSSSGFVLVIVTVLTGAVVKGRIRRLSVPGSYQFHRRISIWAGLILTASFVLGILTTQGHGELPLGSLHGLTGLAVTGLAWLQLVPNLVIRDRARIHIPHRIIGYLLVIAAAFQIVLGLRAAGFV